MSSERRSSGTAGQEERKPPDGAPDSDGARSGAGIAAGAEGDYTVAGRGSFSNLNFFVKNRQCFCD